MTRQHVPQAVIDLAHARRTARAAREWEQADALRAEIESAGWRVVDTGTDFALRPLRAADEIRDGILVHGSSAAVPTRLDEPATMAATVIVVAEGPGEPGPTRAAWAPASAMADGIQVVLVETIDEQTDLGAGEATVASETVRIAATAGPGGIRNAGCRRALGSIVVVAAGAVATEAMSADLVARIVAALADPGVAIVGSTGLWTPDLRRYATLDPPPTDAIADAPAAVTGAVVAFRRSDLRDRGPFDEGFRSAAWLDIWWSLVLRDRGEGPPRRAVQIPSPEASVGFAGMSSLDDLLRQSKRDAYRLAERFAGRLNLASSPALRPVHRP
ncbi:MAG: glycosyltransferase family protein [Candidatus Limnocylindrales bacterium]